MKAKDFILELNRYTIDTKADFLARFFKAGPGEYAEGDKFLGVKVPDTRKVCRQFKDLNLAEIQKLLDSPFHEHRLGGVIILANKYPKSTESEKQQIFELYLKNLSENKINNWDIVDVTCEHIVGAHLQNTDRKLLYKLAKSSNLWERRVAIISTFRYIKSGDPATTIDIAKILLNDKHDLIHKAAGWMLREVGNRVDKMVLTDFLDKYAYEMPRTMLRYSIEKFPPDQRLHYMKLKDS